MKICICKNISDKELEQFQTLEEAVLKTKAGNMCGTCKRELEKFYKTNR